MKNSVNKRLKIGDRVQIITGTQKGIIGKISSLFLKKSLVLVETVLPRIKSIKKKEGSESSKSEIPRFIHISNVMLWDIEGNSRSKIGYKLLNNEKKRYFKKSGNCL
jgi:large subunit ribosomal protein L24